MAQQPHHHPASFACPLTLQVMEDPVRDKCGHNFERKAITEWLQQHDSCCPISRKPLDGTTGNDDLVPNHALAERIEKWKWQKQVGDYIHAADYSAEAQTLSLHSDDDDDDDVEMGGGGWSRRGWKSARAAATSSTRKQKQHQHYEEIVTVECMLLPQELQLLELVQAREDAEQREKERKRTCRLLASLLVLLAALTFGAARVIQL